MQRNMNILKTERKSTNIWFKYILFSLNLIESCHFVILKNKQHKFFISFF
jgi:hypothetical protein